MTKLDLSGATDAPEAMRPLRLLALAGGGYRGLFTCEILTRLEAELQRPLRESFDLVIGTSAGALIAAGVAHGVAATRLGDAFREHGPKIFPRGVTTRLRQLVVGAPYRAEPLAAAISAVLGTDADTLMRHSPANLAIVAVSQTAAEPRIYAAGSFAAAARGDLSVKEAILASAAAPTYFPPRRPDAETLIDGGIVANGPEVVGLGLLNRVYGGVLDRTRVIAVGTAAPASGRPALDPRPFGVLSWMRPSRNLLLLTLATQEQLARALTSDLLGDAYCRLDVRPSDAQAAVMGAIDCANTKASDTMTAMAQVAWERDGQTAIALLSNSPSGPPDASRG